MFELASPWCMVLIILPFFIWWLIPAVEKIIPSSLKIPFYQQLKVLLPSTSGLMGSRALWPWGLVWFLLALALSGPRWIGEPIQLSTEGRNIMLVLDLSGSMALNDMEYKGQAVSRLAVVKNAAKQFVNKRIGDRMGLILFGSQAYLQTPLTFDRRNLLMRIDDATPGLAGQTTSIGDALGLAIKRLQDVPKTSRVIILLTDGVNNSGVLTPIKAAQLAKNEEIKVYTIGLGTAISNNPFANLPANADLDEESLKAIADATGGRYFRATDLTSLRAIYSKIDSLEPVVGENNVIHPQRDYYIWPLALALFILQILIAHLSGWFPIRNRGSES